MLPKPPLWQRVTVAVPGGTTKQPMTLLYRDGMESFRYLFGNPVFAGLQHYAPMRVWTDENRDTRVYDEPMTGDFVWEVQVRYSCTFNGADLVSSLRLVVE